MVVASESRPGLHRVVLTGAPLSLADAGRLEREIGVLREARDTRVVVVESTGPDFCPGVEAGWSPLDSGLDVAAALAAVRCPTVAVLHGQVRSAGLEMALACDLRVAADDARFSLPELLDGRLPCWGATQRLPRVAGLPTAMLLLVGEEVSGADDAARRLAQHVVPRDRLEKTACALVDALLALAPLALELCKEAVHHGSELPMRRGLELEGDLNHLLQSTADRSEGLAAFAAKRAPRFDAR